MKKSLKRLVIDSATPHLYISLLDGEKVIEEYFQKGNNDHSVTLMPTIEEMFTKNKISINDINEIIIGVGPGSYTGVRIGVVIAKMFAWTKEIPVKTVSTLALMASSSTKDGKVLAMIDARRNNAFMGEFVLEQGVLSYLNEEVFGDKSLKENVIEECNVVEFGKPNMKVILQSNVLRVVDDIHLLAPNYLRQTEAERSIKE